MFLFCHNSLPDARDVLPASKVKTDVKPMGKYGPGFSAGSALPVPYSFVNLYSS